MARRCRGALAGCSALGLVAALLLVWLIGNFSRSGVALADVVCALNRLQSIRYTTSVDTGQGHVPESRTLYKTRNLERIEYATGRVFILDRTTGQSLTLFPGERKAIVRSDGVDRKDLFDVVDALENNQRFARVLPEKVISGVRAVGFELKGHSYEHLVWVDVRSRLLVRWETEIRADDGKLTRHVHADFVYNEPLDAALFDLTPPPGFRVEQQGVPELAPLVDDALQSPTLYVREAIGPARFGMSRDEVLKVFGPPDEIDEKLQSYRYPSRGIDLSISPALGLWAVICRTQAVAPSRIRDYAGRTDKGIGMGATAEEIVAAYGPPDKRVTGESSETLSYQKLHLHFSLYDRKLVFIQHDCTDP